MDCIYIAALSKALYNLRSHSPIHTPTAIVCHARYQPARQEQLGVRHLGQGHFDTPRGGSNRQLSDCQTTALTSWATAPRIWWFEQKKKKTNSKIYLLMMTRHYEEIQLPLHLWNSTGGHPCWLRRAGRWPWTWHCQTGKRLPPAPASPCDSWYLKTGQTINRQCWEINM